MQCRKINGKKFRLDDLETHFGFVLSMELYHSSHENEQKMCDGSIVCGNKIQLKAPAESILTRVRVQTRLFRSRSEHMSPFEYLSAHSTRIHLLLIKDELGLELA